VGAAVGLSFLITYGSLLLIILGVLLQLKINSIKLNATRKDKIRMIVRIILDCMWC